MRILITGITGLVGWSLAEVLCARGDYVVGLSRSIPANPIKNCQYEKADLCDGIRVLEIIQKHKITHIIHSGAISHPLVNLDMPCSIVHTNVDGTLHVLEAARIFGVERVLYLSTGGVYGNSDRDKLREEDYCNPISLYGVTKLCGEGLTKAYKYQYNLDTISIRLCSIYGPHCYMPSVVRDMLLPAVKGEDIIREEGGEILMEFQYVTDTVNGIMMCLDAPSLKYDVVNLGPGETHYAYEVAKIIQELFPKQKIRVSGGNQGRDVQGPFDISRVTEWLGYRSEISLKDGIAMYAAWLNEHDK